MNALKNVLFFGLLIAVLFGVYLSLNKQTDPSISPEVASTVVQPKIDGVPDLSAPPSQSGPTDPSASATGPSSFPPPFSPNTTAGVKSADNPGSMAPPAGYGQPQTAGPGTTPPSNPFGARTSTPPSSDYPPPPANVSGTLRVPDTLPPPPATDSVAAAPGASTSASFALTNSASTTAPAWPGPGGAPSTPPAQPDTPHSSGDRLGMITEQVKLKVNEGKFADALEILSGIYDNPDLPPEKAQAITSILDQLAAKVIYSREHLLQPLYVVGPNDTLDSIAGNYHVPALLLARINGIDPTKLRPGMKLKVIKGPFTAFVSIEHGELTMKLEGRYAGRFPLALSSDLKQASGFYTVKQKSGPASEGKPVDQWIELSSPTGTIGLQAKQLGQPSSGRSTMWLSDRDMDDVYGILSVGSRVVIQR